ncbi:hypothetical protein SO802_015002 [Lithocarpus litseifolius]|uniref:E2 ubiquitin-conjugating enzyme n=1 Tax=Lithocarpus litseifolius TaxID=425828 RepID=A0AAW2CXT5_9ROSI
MEPEVIEIPPPIFRTPKFLKQKQVILHDVIDIDKEGDSADVMFIDEKVHTSKKGKEIKDVADGYGHHQAKEDFANYVFGAGVEMFGSVNGVESSEMHNLINLDGHSSDLSYDDNNEYADFFPDDILDVDEYAILQAHFDSMDIPPGIEAPVPWLPDFAQHEKQPVTGSSSHYTESQMHLDVVGPHGIDPSLPSRSEKPVHINKNLTSVSGSSMDSVVHPHSKVGQNKKKSSASHHRGNALNLPLGKESSKSRWFLDPFKSKKKQFASSSSPNCSYVKKLDAMKLPSGAEPSFWGHYTPENVKKQVSSSTYYPTNPVHTDAFKYPAGVHTDAFKYPAGVHADAFMYPAGGHSDPFKYPAGVEPPTPLWTPPLTNHPGYYFPFHGLHAPPEDVEEFPWVPDSAQNQNNAAADGSSTFPIEAISGKDKDEILRRFQLFKQFDTVEDYSDHHYTGYGSTTKQPSKTWAKKIQEEWKILEKDLPDTIFVRVYESRMDLLRAVIVGAEGTPYHDGLFFFDVFFPCGYPNVPPNVYYHSGGLRLNPNLYNCGKVCLSLLNTWSGNKNEKWIPGVSTMLQVLVSIQGLILNTKPYFNEPGYAHMSGSESGEMRSQQYNEDTFVLSLRTMMYTMRRPPKHFEDFVMGHFRNRARDILVACKAYMEGAQVGSLVKGGVQDVDVGDRSCSKRFKDSLAGYVDMLVKAFTQIGAEGCEIFQSPGMNGNKRFCGMPKAAT